MMRYSILFVLIVLISCDSASQFESPGESYFVKFYGEDGNHEGVDFIANSDGTFILLGNEKVAGQSQQIYLVKVDAQGIVIGEPKSYGSSDVDDFAKDIEVTPDGNFIVAGESQTGSGNRDVYILKVDNGLNLIQEKTISGILLTTGGQEADEEVNSISVISDGFIVAGSTTAVGLRPGTDPDIKPTNIKDGLHLRFTNNLDLVLQNTGNWFYTTGKDHEDILVKMIEITPSLYYGFGYSNNPVSVNNNTTSNFNYWAFSIGSTAVAAGYDEYFISGNSVENGILSDVSKSPSSFGDGYVLAGIKLNSTSKESQSYILKLGHPLVQGQNNVVYEESPTDLGSDVGSKTSIAGLAQGGYYLLSNSKLPPSDNIDISLIKLSNSFKTEGRQSIYFGGEGNDFTGAVKELPDGKIMVMGTMTLGGVSGQRKMAFMKLNREGKLIE